jgi:uncharacterized protein with LGFP repeats
MIKISLGLGLLLLISTIILIINSDHVFAADNKSILETLRGVFSGNQLIEKGNFSENTFTSPIYQKYQEIGSGNSFLGEPIGNETIASDSVGHVQNFRGGAIYWSPETGAHEVHGSIFQKYKELGSEGQFGYPRTDEIDTPPKNYCPCYNVFQGGTIYAEIEPLAIISPIWEKYSQKKDVLGSPVGDTQTNDGTGFFNNFQSGVIYWSPYSGAHEVHGSILQKYREMNLEQGKLGYPTSDEIGTNGGCPCHSVFQNGIIYTTPGTNWIPQVSYDFDILDRPEINPNCPKCD